MLVKKYNSILEQSEDHRKRWALGLSLALTALIFVSFGFYKGFISFDSKSPKSFDQVANVISAEKAPSPIQNSKNAFKDAFKEINEQYQNFKKSVSGVLVPFVTGIEVYERK